MGFRACFLSQTGILSTLPQSQKTYLVRGILDWESGNYEATTLMMHTFLQSAATSMISITCSTLIFSWNLPILMILGFLMLSSFSTPLFLPAGWWLLASGSFQKMILPSHGDVNVNSRGKKKKRQGWWYPYGTQMGDLVFILSHTFNVESQLKSRAHV